VSEAPNLEDRFIVETGTEAEVAALVEPVLVDLGFRLVRVKLMGRDDKSRTLQIMAERPDGTMNVNECEAVSRQLSPVLDVHDPLRGTYRLEISSPGIDRPLVRPSDFENWAGYEARIDAKELIDGRRRFKGLLEGFEGGEVRIEIDLENTGPAVIGLPVELIADARLVLTDDLVRESLRRAKQNRKQGDSPGLRDGDEPPMDYLEDE